MYPCRCYGKAFDRNRPFTVDEFLYYYKPSKISQSLGFYQFLARGSSCSLIRSLPLSDRRWKTEFFFVSGFWARNPVEVGKDPFLPYTGEMGRLRPESTLLLVLLLLLYLPNSIFFFSCKTTLFDQIILRPRPASMLFRI